MKAIDDALAEPDPAPARLRALVAAELERGAAELRRKRSGIPDAVTVAIGPGLLAVAPVPATLRADPQEVEERSWLLVAALVGALVEAGGRGILAGDHDGHLLLAARADDAELAALAFDELVAGVDRLRARAVALPADVLEPRDLRPPVGAAHPLLVAEAIAALGANPADPAQVADQEEAVLAALGGASATPPRPHEDPDPARRIARRIVQRLAGMGKWGGYHTEFSHLARGFLGNDKALAEDIGERLIAAGLLAEKHSVGQRHVYLNPRRARDVHALIEQGTLPRTLDLP